MLQKALVLGSVGTLFALIPPALDAQCACYATDPAGPYFDVATVETVVGTVSAVDRIEAARRGWGEGLHLELDTDGGTLMVHLGPAWFLDRQEETFEKDDVVEATGSVATVDGERQMIASTVKRDDTILHLRNQDGYPIWRAWRRSDGHHRCGLGPPTGG